MKTLDEIRAFVTHESARLDPASPNLRELLAAIDASLDAQDLARRLQAGCRGKYWAGSAVFSAMTLPDKIRANLVDCRTSLPPPDAPETAFLRETILPPLALRHEESHLLSLPCAHGQEAAFLAGECVDAGMQAFRVHGIDAQRACIESARSGTVPFPGSSHLHSAFDADVVRHLQFRSADVFRHPLGGPYDLIVCRNFLGYFAPAHARKAAAALCAALRGDNAFLLVDGHALDRHPRTFDGLPLRRIGTLPIFCSFPPSASSP